MMIIGVDYHSSFQQFAFVDQATGECGERRLTNFNAGTIDVFFGNGSGAFSYSASYPTIIGAQSSQTSDIDGDGFPDLFVGTAHGGLFTADAFTQWQFHSLLNYGDGTFGKFRAYFPGPLTAVTTPSARQLAFDVADYTGDFKADLVEVTAGTSANTAALTVFPGAGETLFLRQRNKPSSTIHPLRNSSPLWPRVMWTAMGKTISFSRGARINPAAVPQFPSPWAKVTEHSSRRWITAFPPVFC